MGSVARPRLLDLFCGAGGAAMGYHRAGFEVVGVDIEPQPRYPFEFVQADALWIMDVLLGRGSLCPTMETRYWLTDFDVIHASPPCQAYSVSRHRSQHRRQHPDLIPPIRRALRSIRRPWVIENVIGSPLLDPVMLCGAAFQLGIPRPGDGWLPLRRHRLFESNVALMSYGCACSNSEVVGVYGHGGGWVDRRSGHRKGYIGSADEKRAAMGIEWMTRDELSQAIPPAYTQYIGEQLMTHLAAEGVAA